MPEYGVTESGFVLKRLADILGDLKSNLSTVSDATTGETLTPDLLDEDDPLIQTVNAVADTLANCWEQLQLCYNQFDPLKATGAGLSGLVQLNAIERQAGSPSTVELLCTGDVGKTVTSGKRVTLLDDSVVFELPAFTFDVNGEATVTGTCIVDGPFDAAAGQVVKIITPSAGWDSVTNPDPAVPGQYEQNDNELRLLQQSSTENTGRGMIDDLFSAVYNLEGVTYARAYQNEALITDVRGVDAKSVAVIVLGGDEDEIAQTIYEHVPIGIDYFGAIEKTITDIQGFDYVIRFSRPTSIDYYINITIDPFATNWPTNGADLIKEAVLAASLDYLPGVTVYASQFYTAINSICQSLAQITLVEIGIVGDSAPAGQSIVIDWDEQAILALEDITVTEL